MLSKHALVQRQKHEPVVCPGNLAWSCYEGAWTVKGVEVKLWPER